MPCQDVADFMAAESCSNEFHSASSITFQGSLCRNKTQFAHNEVTIVIITVFVIMFHASDWRSFTQAARDSVCVIDETKSNRFFHMTALHCATAGPSVSLYSLDSRVLFDLTGMLTLFSTTSLNDRFYILHPSNLLSFRNKFILDCVSFLSWFE